MDPTIAGRQHVVNAEAGPLARTPAGDAFTTLLGQVIALTRRFSTVGEALAKPAGQTLARWLVLESVQDAPATVAQVARGLHLARQGVQRLADLLVRDGLAAYEDNPAHRRAKLLRLEPPGRSALGTIQAAQRAWADALGAELGEADLRQASVVLDRVLRAVRKPERSP
ncbi:MAG TPA: MarR family winged helix-turn-helix transcriptional regulator [Actinomycetes bacterium]|jgi:DNA-binding MarR family transcriptional regulator|nr:MarR family winged helix-turn-helix transcriptional regulator [Actinomycetes bacterium]